MQAAHVGKELPVADTAENGGNCVHPLLIVLLLPLGSDLFVKVEDYAKLVF